MNDDSSFLISDVHLHSSLFARKLIKIRKRTCGNVLIIWQYPETAEAQSSFCSVVHSLRERGSGTVWSGSLPANINS